MNLRPLLSNVTFIKERTKERIGDNRERGRERARAETTEEIRRVPENHFSIYNAEMKNKVSMNKFRNLRLSSTFFSVSKSNAGITATHTSSIFVSSFEIFLPTHFQSRIASPPYLVPSTYNTNYTKFDRFT